jgi:hypothetical protein
MLGISQEPIKRAITDANNIYLKMITINKYKQILTGFFKKHLQINTVLFGSKLDLAGNENIIYPVANIQFMDSSVSGNNVIDRFQFTLADLQNPNNNESEIEIINDLTLIAYDLINYLYGDDYEFLFEVSNVTSISPFTDDFGDLISGVTFIINIAQQRIINPCSTPTIDKININRNVFPLRLPFILT